MKEKKTQKNKLQTSELPDEILIEIFKYSDKKTILDAGLTSKHFYELSSSDQVWKNIFPKLDIKKDYKKHIIEKEKQLYKYQDFVEGDTIPTIKVVVSGNAVDTNDSTIKTYPLKLNIQRDENENKPMGLEVVNITMGPKKHKVQFWDTSSAERFLSTTLNSKLRNCQLVLLFPKDIDNLELNKSLLDQLRFKGKVVCCTEQKELLNKAKMLGCITIQFEQRVPTKEEIKKLNKTIIELAGPDSVKELIKEEKQILESKKSDVITEEEKKEDKGEKPSGNKCTIM